MAFYSLFLLAGDLSRDLGTSRALYWAPPCPTPNLTCSAAPPPPRAPAYPTLPAARPCLPQTLPALNALRPSPKPSTLKPYPPPPRVPPAHPRYEDGYSGKEDVITWFWEVVDALDDAHRRQLLQFWSGSDGMPAEGFGALDPAFHVVAVERFYDAADTTARLPAAHTCFRQLDLPRYQSSGELREKIVTAITIGQGYMALS